MLPRSAPLEPVHDSIGPYSPTRSMPAGHWRAFSTKGIGIDSNLRHSFGGTTPDQAIGSQIHFLGQGLGPKTLSVTLFRPSVHTQVLLGRPVSPRGIEVSDRYTILSGRKKSYLACSTSIRPPRQPRSLLSIYLRLSFFNQTGCGHHISQIVPAPLRIRDVSGDSSLSHPRR